MLGIVLVYIIFTGKTLLDIITVIIGVIYFFRTLLELINEKYK